MGFLNGTVLLSFNRFQRSDVVSMEGTAKIKDTGHNAQYIRYNVTKVLSEFSIPQDLYFTSLSCYISLCAPWSREVGSCSCLCFPVASRAEMSVDVDLIVSRDVCVYTAQTARVPTEYLMFLNKSGFWI